MEHRHFYKVPVLLLAAAPLLAAVPRAWNLGAVTLVPAEQAVDGEKLGLLRADARDALTGRLAEVSAEMWLTRVEDSFISNDKLVVLGQAGRAEAVVIFDLLATREIDWFYCYRPRHLSDDWITYVEWYPEHASAEPTDVILVYDLALAPLENRLEKERNVNVPPPARMTIRHAPVSRFIPIPARD